MDEVQQEVIAFLREPGSYPPGIGPIEVVETHASLLFLAGPRVYKLKRAVKYSYLDFSTLARRRAACTAELNLNRRTAPQLYLEVRAICRLPQGGLAWGRAGEPVDFVVVMQRFDQDGLLDNLAKTGRLSAPLIYALTAHIAAFHEKAEIRTEYGGSTALAEVAQTNIACLRDCAAAGFDAAQIDAVDAGLRRELRRVGELLDKRREDGKVRRGHGDLHLGNICLVDGRPLLFDALEFSEAIASIDVLYDLAFLMMDLGHRGKRALAGLALNRYLDLTEEDDGLAAMPLFLALRAVIRAHVSATMAEHGWGSGDAETAFAEACRYLDDAAAALMPFSARLIAVGGLSGSGKSTLAAALAVELAPGPGARVLRSDVLRKLRFNAEPETSLPAQAYGADVTVQVYRDLCRRAAAALRAGWPVIIDAVALREDERRSFAAVAEAAGVPFAGLWLDAPEAAMSVRLDARRSDASDASTDVLRQQLSHDCGVVGWTRIDAGGSAEATLAAARRALLH
ncbi:MAG TPA: AAA family ATPase [Stellaceae bacterium]|jgi:hypothetical protein|nr:AAA family ATPase [Stellaceae bacterium]